MLWHTGSGKERRTHHKTVQLVPPTTYTLQGDAGNNSTFYLEPHRTYEWVVRRYTSDLYAQSAHPPTHPLIPIQIQIQLPPNLPGSLYYTQGR